MKRIAIVSLILIILAGIYNIFINTFEYKSALKLPPKDKNRILIADSFYIDPYLSIDRGTFFVAAISFRNEPDSLFLDNLQVSITSIDKPNQVIKLSHVCAYKDTIIPEDMNRSLIRASSFNDLPNHYKTILLNREDNTILFYFQTDEMEESENYDFKITGKVIVNGKQINFGTTIKALRKKEWQTIQMMT